MGFHLLQNNSMDGLYFSEIMADRTFDLMGKKAEVQLHFGESAVLSHVNI